MPGLSHSYFGVHVDNKHTAVDANTQKYKKVWVPLTNKGSAFLQVRVFPNRNYLGSYIRIISTTSPSFIMVNFSAIVTNCRHLLHKTHDYSRYVSRPILAPPPFWLHKHTCQRIIHPHYMTCDMNLIFVMLPASGAWVHVGLFLLYQTAHIRKNRHLSSRKLTSVVLTAGICD